jgi:hypothetical protein
MNRLWNRRHVASNTPRYYLALRVKVVCYTHLGRVDEARNGVRRLLELDPKSTIARFVANLTGYYPPPLLEVFVDGLRKAGLPEG